MLEKSNKYDLKITGQDNKGDGLGRIEDMVVFVKDTLPGDVVEVEITKVKKRYAYGKLINIISESKFRVKPVCEIYDRCGGCSLQHESYEEQLNYKQQKVKDTIQRIGGIENFKMEDIIKMDVPFRFRNKGVFQAGEKDGKVIFGFFEKGTHEVVKVTDCLIQKEEVKDIIEIVENFLNDNGLKAYDRKTNKGLVKHLFVRVGNKSNEIMVGLVLNGFGISESENLVQRLVSHNENIKSVMLNSNKEKGSKIFGQDSRPLFGNNYINDIIGDVAYKISMESFYQVNSMQTEKLYNKVVEYANLKKSETVIDAYCGIGTISLFLAKESGKVYGIEVLKKAVENAHENKEANEIENVDFVVGKVEEKITEVCNYEKIHAIVVDPPRNGCDERLLNTISSNDINKVIYVSCDPGTLARDIKILVEKGYKLVEVTPVDMFGHTGHVECVVKLQR